MGVEHPEAIGALADVGQVNLNMGNYEASGTANCIIIAQFLIESHSEMMQCVVKWVMLTSGMVCLLPVACCLCVRTCSGIA